MKKLLAVLLSLCLVVGMLPMMAFATDDVADTSQTNFGNTDVLNEGSQDGQDSPGGQSGGDDGGNSDQSGGDQGGGNVPAIPDYNGNKEVDDYDKSVHSGGYNPRSINCYQELLNALKARATPLALGGSIDLEGNITIDYDLKINGDEYNWRGFTGTHIITIKNGVQVEFSGLNVTAPVYVEYGANLVNKNSTIPNVTCESKPEPEPTYYKVSFNVKPSWATVTVTESGTTNTVMPSGGWYTLEEGKTYTYTVSADGFYTETLDFQGYDGYVYEIELTQKSQIVIWPYSHGSVWTEKLSRGWVAVHVEPDSGYYLDDLTIYRVGYGAIDYGKWDNGVYYFRMRAGEQYIIDADFASAPSEYRVYVDSSIMHGDVSVDTVYAEEGEWVYITVDPDVGYRLYNLTVTRPSGNTVKVEHVRDNVYRFSMPGVRVTVDAEFIRTVTPFTDVRLADWFYEYVSFAYRYGLMEGINSYQFAPDASTTRAMVVQILYRMSGEPYVSYSSGFTDVASNAWYSDAIAWAARNNIVNGTGAATFDPNAPVTREQFATMLYRYARYRGFNTSLTANILSYYDVNQVSEYAFEALQWACAEGIVNGTSTGYLTPQGNATRAQLAAMLMRFCTEYFDL